MYQQDSEALNTEWTFKNTIRFIQRAARLQKSDLFFEENEIEAQAYGVPLLNQSAVEQLLLVFSVFTICLTSIILKEKGIEDVSKCKESQQHVDAKVCISFIQSQQKADNAGRHWTQ